MGRHVDGGGGEDGHVGDEPFDAVLGQQPDAVAGPDAGVDEGGGGGPDLFAVFVPAEVVVEAVALEAQGGAGAEALGLAAVHLGEVAVVHAMIRRAAGASRLVKPFFQYAILHQPAHAGRSPRRRLTRPVRPIKIKTDQLVRTSLRR